MTGNDTWINASYISFIHRAVYRAIKCPDKVLVGLNATVYSGSFMMVLVAFYNGIDHRTAMPFK